MHILSQVTDKFPSWISGRERMTVEKISWSISTKKCCRTEAVNSRPPDHQSNAHPTELPSPAFMTAILKQCPLKAAKIKYNLARLCIFWMDYNILSIFQRNFNTFWRYCARNQNTVSDIFCVNINIRWVYIQWFLTYLGIF